MKPISSNIIPLLQEALTAELTATHQYRQHSHLLADWGFSKLAEHEKSEADEEMAHADLLAERILFLDGQPDFSKLFELKIGSNVEEVLKNDLTLEMQAAQALRKAISVCEVDKDYVTRSLFLKILEDEENHIDHLEKELKVISLISINNYLQSQYTPPTA